MNDITETAEVQNKPAEDCAGAVSPVRVALSRPFIVGEATYTHLSIREPFVEDQLAVDEPGLTQGQTELRLIARLCGVRAEALHKLPSCDYMKLQRSLYGFLLPSAAVSAGPRSNLGIYPAGADGK
jgi:hypothetical protein